MKSLKKKIENLRKILKKEIVKKLKEFENNFTLSTKEKFLELCFCILVANTSLEKTLGIWKKIGKGFLFLSKNELRKKLKDLGYRFYNKRSDYIISARKFIDEIEFVLKNKREFEVREWLVKNIKGIGWKEASHFLRNLGYKNFAILDRHVLKILKKYKVIDEIPKNLTKKEYLEIEEKLRKIANSLNVSLAELDFYLFYLDTKKLAEK